MKPKRLFSFSLAVGLLSTFGAAFAQNILPPDGFAPGWKASGPTRVFIEKDLFNHIDGGADLFLEFGFTRVLVQLYTDEKAELILEIYEMTEPSAALGIYLMNAGRETPWPDIPARNSSEDAQIVAVKGRHFLKINNFETGAALRPAMIALAGAALSQIANIPAEDLFSRLPGARRVPGSERLVRGPVGLQPYYTFGEGDVLGLNGNTFGVLANYKAEDGTTFFRLVVEYNSPATAAAAVGKLRANLDPYLTVIAERPDGFDFSDFQKKFGRVQVRDSRMEIKFKLASLALE